MPHHVLCCLLEVSMDIRYITPKQARELFQISMRYLALLRGRGNGPPFVKVGKKVLYRLEDFENWLKQKTRLSRQKASSVKGRS
jgi:hypothetical protein